MTNTISGPGGRQVPFFPNIPGGGITITGNKGGWSIIGFTTFCLSEIYKISHFTASPITQYIGIAHDNAYSLEKISSTGSVEPTEEIKPIITIVTSCFDCRLNNYKSIDAQIRHVTNYFIHKILIARNYEDTPKEYKEYMGIVPEIIVPDGDYILRYDYVQDKWDAFIQCNLFHERDVNLCKSNIEGYLTNDIKN